MSKKKGITEKQIFKKFQSITEATNPKPRIARNCGRAFIVGGAICTIGQFFQEILINYGFPEDEVKMILPIIMIFLGALLTGVGIYDKIASYGGAGTVVPITGFSNAIVAPAIEFKKEGFVFGVAAKMFTIAGPVLVYGIGSSVIIGIIYYFIKLLF
ncbi:stage V sporulation protein AC [Clostridium sp. Sa3CUN1]|uniref:Stage V sporulation protein AC n=1 Tax=Clostridium gallinarum TaxID=2762246 RepID=A0ABR8Q7P0_9CLOT|nr:stage V sporulation protein AC [Clostridium gallinarum]MBD7916443.1 stage V sporulation protein AC [Clostridium gallinarum]